LRELRIADRGPGVGAALLRLFLVVELSQEPAAQLVVVHASVECLAGDGKAAHQNRRVGEIAFQRLVHARVLHLHDHLAAILERGCVHLAERCRGDGVAIEALEQRIGLAAQLRLHDRRHLIEAHPLRRLGKQLRHDAACLGRQRVGIHRQRLTELERGALELSERAEDALGCLAQIRGALAGQLPPRRLREEIARGPGRQVREAAQPLEPAALDMVVVCHRVVPMT